MPYREFIAKKPCHDLVKQAVDKIARIHHITASVVYLSPSPVVVIYMPDELGVKRAMAHITITLYNAGLEPI